MRLRYRGEGNEIDVSGDTAAEVRALLEALALFLTPAQVESVSPAPRCMQDPEGVPDPGAGPEPPRPENKPCVVVPQALPREAVGGKGIGAAGREKRTLIATWLMQRGRPASLSEIHDALSEHFNARSTLSNLIAAWLGNPHCPIERCGHGYYRAKAMGGDGDAADDSFRGAVDAVRPAGGVVEVGAQGA